MRNNYKPQVFYKAQQFISSLNCFTRSVRCDETKQIGRAVTNNFKGESGFSLIELVIFIVVTGIVGSCFLTAFITVSRGTPRIAYQDIALSYAIKCNEWFLGQRISNGFSNIATGVAVPSFCSSGLPSGYNISVTVNGITYGNDSNYKLITTAVTDSRGLGYANMAVVIANY